MTKGNNISIRGWLLVLASIVVSLIFTLIHPNEIIYLFGIFLIGIFFVALIPYVGVTQKEKKHDKGFV